MAKDTKNTTDTNTSGTADTSETTETMPEETATTETTSNTAETAVSNTEAVTTEEDPATEEKLMDVLGINGASTLTGLVEYNIMRALGLGRIKSLALTAGLQFTGILPNTLSPLIKTAGNLLSNINTDLGNVVNNIGNVVANIEGKFGATPQDSLFSTIGNLISGVDNQQPVTESSLSQQMQQGGINAVKNGGLDTISNDPEALETLGQIIELPCRSSIENLSYAASQGELNDETKQNAANHFIEIAQGFDTYNKNIADTIPSYYTNQAAQQQAYANADAIAQVGGEQLFSYIHTADETYGILSDKDKEILNGISFPGVGTYEDYCNAIAAGTEMETEAEQAETEAETEVEAKTETTKDRGEMAATTLNYDAIMANGESQYGPQCG